MNHGPRWDHKTTLYAIGLGALLFTFTFLAAPPVFVGHRGESFEMASRAYSEITLGFFFAMSLLSAPFRFIFFTVGVLGIMSYNGHRINKKIERSVVTIPDPHCQRLLDDIAREAGVEDVELLVVDSSFPNAFVFDKGSKHHVAVSITMLELLEIDELRSVLAHEVAHIKNKDRRIKILGLILGSTYFFLPFVPLMLKAIFRRREYLADETAAMLEDNPLPLMSALLKVTEYVRSFSGTIDLYAPAMSYAFVQRPSMGLRRIFSSSPTIEDRIRNLLRLIP
jgi:Zn-dependent protease with chaperone function